MCIETKAVSTFIQLGMNIAKMERYEYCQNCSNRERVNKIAWKRNLTITDPINAEKGQITSMILTSNS